MAKWLLSDLHIHTTFSDGDIPLDEVVGLYGEAGFDVIAITDHLFDTQSPRSLELYEGTTDFERRSSGDDAEKSKFLFIKIQKMAV